MADWGAALVARLEAHAGAVGLLGSLDWGIQPQSNILAAELRATTLRTISDERPDHYSGEQGLRVSRVQVNCWSVVSADDANAQAERALAIVRPVPGDLDTGLDGSFEQGGVRFDRPQADGPWDGGEQLDTIYAFCARLDLLVWHAETEEG